jgi:hypothetical protein
METEGISKEEATKKTKKFYKKDYVDELINDDVEYQRLLIESEKYIQKNKDIVVEKGRDAEFINKSEDDENPKEEYEEEEV